MEKAGGKELMNQKVPLIAEGPGQRSALPFCSAVGLDRCLTKSIHSCGKGKVLKLQLMHFTLSMDLAIVMVTFFKTPSWGFHTHATPVSTLERK